jgi:DNA-binding protein H-NS
MENRLAKSEPSIVPARLANTFESLSLDELWKLHQDLLIVLERKIVAETRELNQRLKMLKAAPSAGQRSKRQYPQVRPKFRNPDNPHDVWSGRGRRPHWVTKKIEGGKSLDELLIAEAEM